jgi:hypothetical protein
MEEKRKPGGQLGNQNARTHGFYSKELDERGKIAYLLAVEVEGLDYEIALMRVKIQALIAHDPENVRLITQAANTLARLLTAQHNISNKDEKNIKNAFRNVYNEIAVALGLSDLSQGLRK